MNRKRCPPSQPKVSPGFALITGLLFLVVMSLIGVSTMRVTRLETMMAGGTREAHVAFQAAEAALRDGENLIEATTSEALDALNGTLSRSETEPDYFADDTWTDASSDIISGGYPEMHNGNQPRRIIKRLRPIVDPETERQLIEVTGYDPGQTMGGSVSLFRVTAKGTSRDGSAETLLQSHFGRRY
jgi:type IV pilus assembly protein PilX